MYVGRQGWEKICREMEAEFRRHRFETGVMRGIDAVSIELAKYFPAQGPHPNELPDRPVVI
jgi:uncharacterized membrane protein